MYGENLIQPLCFGHIGINGGILAERSSKNVYRSTKMTEPDAKFKKESVVLFFAWKYFI